MKASLNKSYLLLFLAALVLSGCAGRRKLTDRERLKVKIHMARLSDVPIPVGSEPLIAKITDKSFAYNSNMSVQDLLDYYMPEMEHYGWQLISKFDSIETQIVFTKPHKMVSIIISEYKNLREVLILSTDK